MLLIKLCKLLFPDKGCQGQAGHDLPSIYQLLIGKHAFWDSESWVPGPDSELAEEPSTAAGEVVEPVGGEDESQTRVWILLGYEFCLYREKLGNGGRASSLLRTSLSPAREWG